MSAFIEPTLAHLFNLCFGQMNFLLCRGKPIVLSSFKAGDLRETNNCRQMCNLSAFVKVLKSLVSEKLGVVSVFDILLNYQ